MGPSLPRSRANGDVSGRTGNRASWGRLAIGTVGAAGAVAALVGWMIARSRATSRSARTRALARPAVFPEWHDARTFEAVDVVLRSAVERPADKVIDKPAGDRGRSFL
jgi:hypothetical protein